MEVTAVLESLWLVFGTVCPLMSSRHKLCLFSSDGWRLHSSATPLVPMLDACMTMPFLYFDIKLSQSFLDCTALW